MAGGCLGRLVGQMVAEISGSDDVHPGIYALVGAAGELAGFSRMPLSICLIMAEITSNIRLMLPLMASIMVSKAVADNFIPSVYDVTMGLKAQYQMLDGEYKAGEDLTVHDICSRSVVVLHCQVPLGTITTMLSETAYHAFPLVEGSRSNVVGMIFRSKLVYLAEQHKDDAQSTIVELTKLADLAPDTKHWQTPASRAFRDFVSMGLQQLCIVDSSHALCGIVTRTDLCRLCTKSGLEALREHLISELSPEPDGTA